MVRNWDGGVNAMGIEGGGILFRNARRFLTSSFQVFALMISSSSTSRIGCEGPCMGWFKVAMLVARRSEMRCRVGSSGMIPRPNCLANMPLNSAKDSPRSRLWKTCNTRSMRNLS